MERASEHVPVLLKEVVELASPRPGMSVIDGTLDGGGHAAEMLSRIGPEGKFLGIDLDAAVLEDTAKRLSGLFADVSQMQFVHGNFADTAAIAEKNSFPLADILLLDLGFSSVQLVGKGMSFLYDEPLDMRFDPKENSPTVAWVVNTFPEDRLAKIFSEFGNERYAYRVARCVVEARKEKVIASTSDLVRIITRAVPKGYERGRIHPATRVFQALRIFVNGELDNLTRIISDLPHLLKSGGVALVISFHSLEDRIVKNAFRNYAKSGEFTLLTKKPITSTEEEVAENPQSRSAKLRGIRRN